MARIGIIGGSGLYDIEGLTKINKVSIDTPFGSPSDEFITGALEGEEVVFLPRHGKAHRILPTELNYRANIYAMKKLGVERIISVSAVGSFKKEIKPCDFLLVDQFVDRTNQARKTTFFGQGIVAHIGFAEPVCGQLVQALIQSAKTLQLDIHPQGTYLNMEGPAFSTKAESCLYKSWGMDVIGMTNLPEARLSREAEICYATLAMVTDYDCWHAEEEAVSADLIFQNMRSNVQNAKKLIKAAILNIPRKRDCLCSQALKGAIVTAPENIPAEVKKKLDIIIGKYI
ncbi:MAG: S-methyl-5'-thioadenosine phosphorylase [Candidatus Omnitrophica bacterium]|nr:S-methyl-5'-thioadenosine phosphorylase [Candidatus Omnitrophota bacterium]